MWRVLRIERKRVVLSCGVAGTNNFLIKHIMNQKNNAVQPKVPENIRAFRIVWQGIPIYLKWEPEAHSGIISHLEIQSENRVPIPITRTGYRSHFCHRSEIEEWG